MDAKIWVLLAIVITVQCRDIIVGSINSGHKIFDENKQASPALWRRMENVTITANESETIGGIIVTDLREEKDGDAKIVEGGEGQNNVTIELKSPAVLRGFDFHIEAYAVSKNQQKSTEQEIRTVESDKSTENSKAETSLNTDASIPINLAKTQTSSSSETSLASITNKAEKNNQRQNRDTRNIEKFTQQTNPVQLFTDTSTTVTPEGIESHTLENKYASTQVSEQRHDFHVPKILLHEFSRMPESTARNVPISVLKIMEGTNYHREGHREPDQNIYGDNKRYTQVDYPQFNINDNNKTPVPSTVNTEMPTIENKNKNLRKKRDMGHEPHNPIISNKEGLTSSKRFTNDDNTSEIPTVLHFDTDVSVNDGNTPVVSLGTENTERNSRATVSDTKTEMLSSTNILKHNTNNNINSNQNKPEVTTNLKGTKPGEVTGEATIKPQENIEVPVEFKSEVSDSTYPINLTTDACENSKQSERKTRDTKDVNKTDKNNNEKLSPNISMAISAEMSTSTQKGNTDNKDNKSAITSTTEAEKTITYKDEKLQQRLPITVATDPKTTESRINPKFEMINIPQQFYTNVSVKENSQSPKIPRDVKETDKVGPNSASIEEIKSDMSLKDIKVSSTDSIVTPTGVNKEQAKMFENNRNESTEKSR